MRDHRGALSFDPRLPAAWPSLSYTLHWHGTRLKITVRRDEMTVTAGEGADVSFTVRGAGYTVAAGEAVTVPLQGQGPVIAGRPTLKQIGEQLREDGTLLSASVPDATAATSVPVHTGTIPVVTVDSGTTDAAPEPDVRTQQIPTIDATAKV
jgi:alpha,alpha-trehalose phosphorylase